MHGHLEVVRDGAPKQKQLSGTASTKPDLAALQPMQGGCAYVNSLELLILSLPNTCLPQVNTVLSGGQFQKLMVAASSVTAFRPSSQKVPAFASF